MQATDSSQVGPSELSQGQCMQPTRRLLRLPQVIDRTGIKKTKLYELQRDGLFPMRIQITSHAVG